MQLKTVTKIEALGDSTTVSLMPSGNISIGSILLTSDEAGEYPVLLAKAIAEILEATSNKAGHVSKS